MILTTRKDSLDFIALLLLEVGNLICAPRVLIWRGLAPSRLILAFVFSNQLVLAVVFQAILVNLNFSQITLVIIDLLLQAAEIVCITIQ